MLGKKNLETALALGLILALIVYVVVRAIVIPITYDEAATFFHYIHLGKFWPGEAHWDANNHVLNSMLSWFCYKAFGNTEFILRLPNVVFGFLYLFVSYKFSLLVSDKKLRWALFLALAGCHFVIEFFSVSRGYGMSIALLITSLYFGYCWMQSSAARHIILCILFLQLATLANLSLLLTNLLMLAGLGLWQISFQRKKWVSALSGIAVGIFCVRWFANLSFEYKSRGLLYYGPGDSFWDVTILSLAEFAFPSVQTLFVFVVPIAVFIILSSSIFLFTKSFKSPKENFPSLLFSHLFLGNLTGNFLLHLLFDVNYPADRVAIQYLLFAPLAIVFCLQRIQTVTDSKAVKKWSVVLAIPLFIFPLESVLSANLSHITLWQLDASAREFYNTISADFQRTKKQPTTTGYRLRALPFNYYNLRNGGMISPIQWAAYQGEEADFQMCVLEEAGKWENYDTISYHPVSGLHLLQRNPVRERKVLFSKHTDPIQTSTEPYFVWYEADNDTLGGRDLIWDVKVIMPALSQPFEAWVTVDFGDPHGNSLAQETIVVDWLKTTWEAGEIFHHQLLVPNIPPEATHVKLYFWNIHQQPISFGNVDVTLYELMEETKNSSTLP